MSSNLYKNALATLTILAGITAAAIGILPAIGADQSTVEKVEAPDHAPGQLLVRFERGASGSEIAAQRAKVDASEERVLDELGVRVWQLPDTRVDRAIEVLREHPRVEFAERDGIAAALETTPTDPLWPQQWGSAVVRAPQAWTRTTGSPSILVAVVDSGVDASHPDLQGALVPGRNIIKGTSNPTDDNGHGTKVTGVVAARSNNGIGVAGMCWECSIMPVKVLNSFGFGSWSDIAAGIVWATDNGADVINLSLGGSTPSQTLEDAVAYAHDRGAVLVAAAGNSGNDKLVYPAAYDEVMGVSGTDVNDRLYSWSSYGAHVSVAAPGCNVTTGLEGGYGDFCGTSSASPVVAGLAGLALAHGAADSGAVRQALESGAIDVGVAVVHGRVDAPATLDGVDGTVPDPDEPPPADDPSPDPDDPAEPGDPVDDTPAPGDDADPPPDDGDDAPEDVPTITTSYKGAINQKQPERSFALTVGAGETTADLDVKKGRSLLLRIVDSEGAVVASANGPSGMQLAATLAAGTYLFVVSREDQASFTLTVTHPEP